MSSGFNTDIEVGGRIFHVQTEDRGPEYFVIDTAVYHNGQVLYRHSRSYEHFVKSPEFNRQDLRERVEEQHRCMIEDLQAGVLDAEIGAALDKLARAAGIQVQLVNTKSWLSSGEVSLELETVRRADLTPERDVEVEVTIEGAGQDATYCGRSDDCGRLVLRFPLPTLGKDDLTLVIRASSEAGHDEIRFGVRAKPKVPAGAV
ncbi:MAG TPA: hypothetical protein VG322_01890 [Candidatus Acidoferrales bacterium]|jgi:hypothetical protein|nr:hypothetical protein [Candidatus Acidoferrales bacterium]